MKQNTIALLMLTVLVISIASIPLAAAAPNHPPHHPHQKHPNLKDRVNTLEQALIAIQDMFDDIQAQLDGISSDLDNAVSDLSASIASLDNRVTTLESNSGGGSDDDSALEARVAALETALRAKKAIKFDQNGAQITGISAPSGQSGTIYYAALDNSNCILNSVDLNPPNGDFIQYNWCPQSQVDRMLIENENVTQNSVISISIMNQPKTVGGSPFAPINCWAGSADNFTVADGGTGDPLTIEGFLVQCSGFTKSGMTMQATIDNP